MLKMLEATRFNIFNIFSGGQCRPENVENVGSNPFQHFQHFQAGKVGQRGQARRSINNTNGHQAADWDFLFYTAAGLLSRNFPSAETRQKSNNRDSWTHSRHLEVRTRRHRVWCPQGGRNSPGLMRATHTVVPQQLTSGVPVWYRSTPRHHRVPKMD